MANLTDQDVTPYLDSSLVLPQGAAFDHIAVMSADGVFFASLNQVRAALATPTPPVNQPPTVALTATPSTGVTPGQTVTLFSGAADSDGTVQQVQFFLGTTPIGTVSAAPFNFDYATTTAGTYVFTCVVTDNAGATTTSTPVTVQVGAASPPPTPPVYSTTLNSTTPTADGMSLAPPTTEQLKFNLITGTSGPQIGIAITVAGAKSYIDYASEYVGQGYAYIDAAGTRHDGVFPSSDNLNITY